METGVATVGMSYSGVVNGVAEFLETAIHTLLFVRGVYAENLFVRRRKFDAVVYQARHPALRDYIQRACTSVRDEMLLGTVERVAVVITDGEATLERFVFGVRSLLEVEPEHYNDGIPGAPSASSLAQLFRALMLKLASSQGMLNPLELSDDASFAVVIELKEGVAPSTTQPTEPSPWVPARKADTTRGAKDDPATKLHWISAVETGVVNLSLSVQESGTRQAKPPPQGHPT
ncbi:DNA-binding protein [Auriculariales sp. MPI-PUGE-AT-0066]|nr:DNA-binding protein [Auriculariales sp. MPI-PUGE-AT-0066]